MWTYVAAVEEVSKGEQRGEDVAQGFVLLQLLHSLLQILQRFRYFLQTARSTFGVVQVTINRYPKKTHVSQVWMNTRCTLPPSPRHLLQSERMFKGRCLGQPSNVLAIRRGCCLRTAGGS